MNNLIMIFFTVSTTVIVVGTIALYVYDSRRRKATTRLGQEYLRRRMEAERRRTVP